MNASRIATALRALADAIEDAPEEKPRRRRGERRPPAPSSEPNEQDLADADKRLRAKGWGT